MNTMIITEAELLDGGAGDDRFLAAVGKAAYGGVTFDPEQRNVTYIPPLPDEGGAYPDQDSFTYRVENSCGNFDEATVYIVIEEKIKHACGDTTSITVSDDWTIHYARSSKKVNKNTTLTSLGVPAGGKMSILGYDFVNQNNASINTLISAITFGDDQIPGASPTAEETFLLPYHTMSISGADGIDVADGADGYFYLYFPDPPTPEELAMLPAELFGTPVTGQTTGHSMAYVPFYNTAKADPATFSKPRYGTVKVMQQGFLYIPNTKGVYKPDYWTYKSRTPDDYYVQLFYVSINGGA